jgi:hypothetical protein
MITRFFNWMDDNPGKVMTVQAAGFGSMLYNIIGIDEPGKLVLVITLTILATVGLTLVQRNI